MVTSRYSIIVSKVIYMTSLPVVIGMGGINAAGRTSFHQGFRRIVIDKINAQAREETFVGLASLMKLVSMKDGQLVDQAGNIIAVNEIEAKFGQQILDGTLIRKIEKNHFDVDATPWQQKMTLTASDEQAIVFEARRRDLPQPIPSTWLVEDLADKKVKVTISAGVNSAVVNDISNPELFTDDADKALYFAKQHGRNQVISFPIPQ